MKFHYSTVLSWLVTFLTPLFLLGLALRIMLAPWFLSVEYNLPYFPADEYGFTTADRLHWAPYALDYLVNSADIFYLGGLQFEDGSPLYNERELSHMLDVKLVTRGGLRAWYVSLILLALLGLWAWRGNWMQAYRQGLRRGGWLMILLAAAIGGFAAVAFWQFFTLFHGLFFEGDSWLFYYSDTLIRLFPMQFWQDVFTWVGGITLGGALALAFGLKPKAS
jgi:integral membrane protein (TIGR01906 family)